MDMSKAGEEPAKGTNPPDLLTTPQLQQVLDTWRLTGESPLPELRKSDLTYWTRFSTIDLRLMHHITTLSSDMYRRGYSACTPWTPKMSKYVNLNADVWCTNTEWFAHSGVIFRFCDECLACNVSRAFGLADEKRRHRPPGISSSRNCTERSP